MERGSEGGGCKRRRWREALRVEAVRGGERGSGGGGGEVYLWCFSNMYEEFQTVPLFCFWGSLHRNPQRTTVILLIFC